MIGKTNSQTGGAIKGEKLNISLKSNQSTHDDLLGAIITVTHPGGTTQYPWEGSEITVNIPPYVEYSVEYSAVEGYATPAKFESTAVSENYRTLTAEYKTTVITASIGSNQTDKTDVADATVTIGGKALKNGQSAKFATGSSLTATFSAVTGYATPASQDITASGTAMTVSGTYNSTFVTVKMADNQASLNDIASATAKVAASGITTQTVSDGGVVKVPTGASCTVTWNALTDYKTPAAQTFTTSGASVTKTGTYQTELVSVTLSADDGSSVNGATVKINGKSQTWNGTALTQKVAFGTSYTVEAGDMDGFVTPDSQTYTADQSSRNLSFVYKASAIKVNILSNQDNDSTIAAVKATLAYGSTSVEVSNGQTVNVPSNTAITITFPEVEGYLAPETITFTHTGGQAEKTGTYQCELLTVNVSSDNGSVSGYEVTISKQETVGVATKYTKLEYIENPSSAWIDTGFTANGGMKATIGIMPYDVSSQKLFFGSHNPSSDTSDTTTWQRNCIAIDSSTQWEVGQSSNVYRFDAEAAANNIYDIEFSTIVSSAPYAIINGTKYTGTYTAGLSITPKTTVTIMRDCYNTTSYLTGRIYYAKIYDKSLNLVRDYVPVLRSDGVAGLYDVVNDTFTPSSGSVGFAAGEAKREEIAVQTSVTGTYKIPFDTSYMVQASKVNGYDTPAKVSRVASQKNYTVTQEYKVVTVRDLSLYDVYGNPINRSTANCYVVREPGQYKFPCVYGNAIKNGKVNTAAFTNNGGSYSHDFVTSDGKQITTPYLNPTTANLANTDTDGVITDLQIVSGDECNYIQFSVTSVPTTGANCLIWAYSAPGLNNWQWHIWLWPHDLSPVEITNSTGVKYNIMPVNLASKYDSNGVHIKNWFYQWGRMTPLLCPASYNSSSNHSPGTITTSSTASDIKDGINIPDRFYYNSSSPYNWFDSQSYYNLWDAACTGTGNSDNDTVKTVYDPCPVGWKVPNGNTFTGLSIISESNGIVKMARYSGDTTGVEFPLSGYRGYSDGSLDNVGSYGYVWLSSAYSQNYAYTLYFRSGSVNPQNSSFRANGFGVRPVEDDNIQLDVIESTSYIDLSVLGQGSKSFTFESGMTWFEWVNSEYNTYGLVISGNFVMYGSSYILHDSAINDYANMSSNIKGGHNYVLTEYF